MAFSTQVPRDDEPKIVMLEEKRPLHAQIVSFGAFILISLLFFTIINLAIGALSGWITSVHVGLDLRVTIQLSETLILTTAQLLTLVWGSISSIAFGISVILWLVFKKKIFLYHTGKLLRKALILFLCILIFFTLGIGYGIIAFFAAFLWVPKFTVNWDKKQLQIYRLLVLLPILVVMLVEMTFTRGNVGFTLIPAFLTLSASSLFGAAGIPWVSFAALGIVIPVYLFLPRAFLEAWKFRPHIESFWQEFLYHPLGIIGLIIISAIVAMALLAPWIAPYHWGEGSLQIDDLLQPPSSEHPLGTNHRGEDIFSRFVYAAQISLLVGFAASVVAVFLGTFIGLISGYHGGIIDTILMRVTDVFLCLPTLPLMLIFLLIFGRGLQNVIFVIALLGWTGTARMVRSEALSLRERPLTEAAHALGASDTYILIHHIMPNTFPLILANMILGVVNAILGEAGIAFLGFVDIHGQPSWGIMLHWAWKNAAMLGNRWWWFIPPGILIMLTTLGFVFISHTADKVVNPRLRGRRG